jgi:hypothetical protein
VTEPDERLGKLRVVDVRAGPAKQVSVEYQQPHEREDRKGGGRNGRIWRTHASDRTAGTEEGLAILPAVWDGPSDTACVLPRRGARQ